MKTILIAEDDTHIRTGLIDLFESEGYAVSAAEDGAVALKLAAEKSFDLILLDVMMPKKSGYDVCKEIRKTDMNTPVIMLTAKGEEIDKVVGLQIGADDYVTKPFGVHELIARTEAVLRRSKRSTPLATQTPDHFLFGTSTIDAQQYTAETDGKCVELSPREMELLRCFYNQANKVISRDQLLNEVWGIDYFGTTRTLDQHISQLRKKVDPAAIQTVHGIGYRYCT